MKTKLLLPLLILPLFLTGLALPAANKNGFRLDVLVNGYRRREYHGRTKTYVEALRGRDYSLRIHNPLSRRVAVALSVDGLNTVDAKRSDARSATKWVLEPHETIVISGWQINANHARHFYFTGEKHSYGAYLGKTSNLGVIEAVFFAEKSSRVSRFAEERRRERLEAVKRAEAKRSSASNAEEKARPKSNSGVEGGVAGGMLGAVLPEVIPEHSPKSAAQAARKPLLDDKYAATGIGRKHYHPVSRINMELEYSPRATITIRYEFRSQLVKLGLIPRSRPHRRPTPFQRREGATGFKQAWCPNPYKR